MKELHFKIKTGFGEDEYLEISESELQTATTCWIDGNIFMGKDGFWDFGARKIMGILPDFAKSLGRTRGYKLTYDDYVMIDRYHLKERCQEALESAVRKVKGQPEPQKKLHSENSKAVWKIEYVVPVINIVVIENISNGERLEITVPKARELEKAEKLITSTKQKE